MLAHVACTVQMADYIISCNVHSGGLQITLGHSMSIAALMMTINAISDGCMTKRYMTSCTVAFISCTTWAV